MRLGADSHGGAPHSGARGPARPLLRRRRRRVSNASDYYALSAALVKGPDARAFSYGTLSITGPRAETYRLAGLAISVGLSRLFARFVLWGHFYIVHLTSTLFNSFLHCLPHFCIVYVTCVSFTSFVYRLPHFCIVHLTFESFTSLLYRSSHFCIVYLISVSFTSFLYRSPYFCIVCLTSESFTSFSSLLPHIYDVHLMFTTLILYLRRPQHSYQNGALSLCRLRLHRV